MHLTNDNDILAAVKKVCGEFNCSPAIVIGTARDALEWSKTAVIPNFGPSPQHSDEAEITKEILIDWPEWVEDMVPSGSKWERLHWPDGSITIRLLNPRGLVLAAQHFPPRQEKIGHEPKPPFHVE